MQELGLKRFWDSADQFMHHQNYDNDYGGPLSLDVTQAPRQCDDQGLCIESKVTGQGISFDD